MNSIGFLCCLLYCPEGAFAALLRGQRIDDQTKHHYLQQRSTTNYDQLTVPSYCLEDPDHPDCQRILRKLQSLSIPKPLWENTDSLFGKKELLREEELMLVTDRPDGEEATLPDFPAYEVASSSPTQDYCYGNMARLAYRKFCSSEMPSVSLEPSEAPSILPGGAVPTTVTQTPSQTHFVMEPPSMVPTHDTTPPSLAIAASLRPATSPTIEETPPPTLIGMCQGDCNAPSDCDHGLYCYQREAYQDVPGCPQAELDGSRMDYCTIGSPPTMSPVAPPSEDSFRLELYWNTSYWWQETNIEQHWCMACRGICEEGESLYIHDCEDTWNMGVYFDFWWNATADVSDEDDFLMHIVNTAFCLERHIIDEEVVDDEGESSNRPPRGGATLEVCNTTNPLQAWTSPISANGGNTVTEDYDHFEIGQRPLEHHLGRDLCLTTHHHPKDGEEVEVFPCSVARRDNSSYWISS